MTNFWCKIGFHHWYKGFFTFPAWNRFERHCLNCNKTQFKTYKRLVGRYYVPAWKSYDMESDIANTPVEMAFCIRHENILWVHSENGVITNIIVKPDSMISISPNRGTFYQYNDTLPKRRLIRQHSIFTFPNNDDPHEIEAVKSLITSCGLVLFHFMKNGQQIVQGIELDSNSDSGCVESKIAATRVTKNEFDDSRIRVEIEGMTERWGPMFKMSRGFMFAL